MLFLRGENFLERRVRGRKRRLCQESLPLFGVNMLEGGSDRLVGARDFAG